MAVRRRKGGSASPARMAITNQKEAGERGIRLALHAPRALQVKCWWVAARARTARAQTVRLDSSGCPARLGAALVPNSCAPPASSGTSVAAPSRAAPAAIALFAKRASIRVETAMAAEAVNHARIALLVSFARRTKRRRRSNAHRARIAPRASTWMQLLVPTAGARHAASAAGGRSWQAVIAAFRERASSARSACTRTSPPGMAIAVCALVAGVGRSGSDA